MSKKLGANILCPNCKHKFPTQLFRSIWVEDPSNRSLVLSDQINAVTCPRCKFHYRLEFPFLCTNVKCGFALWYEPYHDPQIDKDVAEYSRHFGPNSFYAQAPRIADWNTFKRKLLEMESLVPQQHQIKNISTEMQKKMIGFIAHLKDEKNRNGSVASSNSLRTFLKTFSENSGDIWDIMGYLVARIVAVILLFWALDKHSYGYYTLLRFVVCGVSAYGAYFAVELGKNGWAWTLGIIAILFNPLIPIHLDKDTWAVIDSGVAIVLVISLFLLRKPKSKKAGPAPSLKT